ncbi:class I SAM-dependent methyltransferase [Chloroflexota bacterium]
MQPYTVDYEQSAGGYATHRQIHCGVLRTLSEGSNLGSGSAVLEAGCGTGNYVRVLAQGLGCSVCGLDPSAAMLAHARTLLGCVAWVLGRAEQIPLAGDLFHLVFSVDVIHHVSDKAAFYGEVVRVLQFGGAVCTVTDSEEIIRRREVLSGYFPETIEIELARYPRVAQLKAWMAEAGLVDIEVVTVEEPYIVTSPRSFRAKAYSALQLISDGAWRSGLERLERDLALGPIRGASRYACVWGRRPGGGVALLSGA